MQTIRHTYLTLEALAAELALPKSYLKELIKKGLIPYLNVNGRQRFNITNVSQALNNLANQRTKNVGGSVCAS